jgi:hypothetical protein
MRSTIFGSGGEIVRWRGRALNKEMNRNDTLTRDLARYLVAAIQQKFQNSLELWRKYLKRIKTSAYLMGEKFKLFLSWTLKFTTIDRILAGDFSTKEQEKPLEEQKAEAEAHIASLDEEPECLQIRRNFLQSVDLALSVAEYFHINMKDAKIIVEKVSCAVKNCRNIAKNLNISNREIELMENAFRL